jgi:uncharacterized membrane protein YbaN (DUF454 family)
MVDELPGGRRSAAQPPTMSAARLPYLALGGLSLGLGVIGAFVPLMPTTVFLIVATWAFARSSPRLYRAILDHPRWGPSLHHWHTHRCLSRRTKTIAIASIAVSFALSAYVMRERLGLVSAVGLLLLAVVAYLITRPRCVMDGRHPTDPGIAANRAPHSPVG